MKGLLSACFALASFCAHADDLSISVNGVETYYTGGKFVHIETRGLEGTVIFNAAMPASTTESSEAFSSIEAGNWLVIVRDQDDGTTMVDRTMQCSAHVAIASTCGTVRLTCMTAIARPQKSK